MYKGEKSVKNNVLIWGTAILLIVIPIYVTNKNKFTDSNTYQPSSATQSQLSNINSSFNQNSPVLIDFKPRQKATELH
jgi:hypothetical protein